MKAFVHTISILVCFSAVVYAAQKEAAPKLPADVAGFKERRDLCEHFRGEDPYDRERRRFLDETLKQYCAGTDAELAALKAKYKGNETVKRVLEKYEEKIEAAQ